MIKSKQFWLGAAERAVKTFLQTFIAVLGVTLGGGVITPEHFASLPWLTSLTSAALAAFLSIATTLSSAQITNTQTKTETETQETPAVSTPPAAPVQ